MKKLLLLTILALMAAACSDQKIDTTKARQEMEAREIKRVSEGEIVEKALSLGNQLTKEAELSKGSAGGYLLSSQNTSTEQIQFIPFSDIQLFKNDGKRFQIYDAYAYNAENGIDSQAGVQILEGDTILLYTRTAYFEDEAVGILSIDLSRKDIVLSIEK